MNAPDAGLRAAVIEARAEVARLSPGENSTQADRDAWALALANRIVVEEKFIDAALASSPAPPRTPMTDDQNDCPICSGMCHDDELDVERLAALRNEYANLTLPLGETREAAQHERDTALYYIDRALASSPAPAGLAPAEVYVRGHWDGLHCDANGGAFGILDECEHVGRIHEPRAASSPAPAARYREHDDEGNHIADHPAPAGLDVAIAEVVAREAADAAFPDSAVAREHFLVGYRAATRRDEDAG